MIEVVALIWDNGSILNCQRPGSAGLLWESVGGKVETVGPK